MHIENLPMVPLQKKLIDKSKQLEATFLAEMLRHAGGAQARGEFSGGIGEEQFSSFLSQEYARAIVEQHSLGLTDKFYDGLRKGGA